MQPQRRSALRLLLVGLAAGACTEQTPPTGIPVGVNAAVTAAAGANNQKVKVKTMQLASNTLRIDGPSVTGQVSIGNSGLAIPANVVLRGEITQGAASRQAGVSYACTKDCSSAFQPLVRISGPEKSTELL